ncbi:MAG: ATP-binding cassette domain-containing protein, partial [Deltaproteobacteria bacterium]|nr:ATP-binding cassette domain-containing protein [Deltaproteobacteria bacterium]
MSEPLIRVSGLCKSFETGDGTIEVLRGLDFEIHPGECLAIVGSSGVGKSTLLHILGALDHPTSGSVEFRGEDLFANSSDELARFRSDCLGFIFQFHHLLPEFNALENVMMPGLIANESLEPLR